MKHRITNTLMFIFQCMFMLSMVWIFVLTIKRTTLEYPVAILLFLGIVVIIGYFMMKQKERFLKNWNKIFLILWLISAVVMIMMAFNLKVDMYNTWDYGFVLRSAYEWAAGGKITSFEYYIRYPNNQFLLLLISCIMKCVLKVAPSADIYFCQNVTIVFNIVIIQLSIGLAHLIANQLLKGKTVVLSDLLVITCSPLYLYAAIMYTDTVALFPLMLLIYCLLSGEKQLEKNHWRGTVTWFIVGGAIAAIGYYVKMTIVFFCIGFFIYAFLKIPWKKWLLCFICIMLGFVLAYAGTKKIISLQSDYTESQYDLYQFPYTHWVMMALGPNGRYNQDDVNYTLSFDSIEEKKEGDIQRIKERIESMGPLGLIEHELYEKIYHAWTQGALCADDYIHRQPLSNGLLRKVFALDGQYHKGYMVYAQTYWMILILGMILTSVRYLRCQQKLSIHSIQITIFGLFMFLLLWESNPRYLMHYLLIFCIVSAYGYGIIEKEINDSKFLRA